MKINKKVLAYKKKPNKETNKSSELCVADARLRTGTSLIQLGACTKI